MKKLLFLLIFLNLFFHLHAQEKNLNSVFPKKEIIEYLKKIVLRLSKFSKINSEDEKCLESLNDQSNNFLFQKLFEYSKLANEKNAGIIFFSNIEWEIERDFFGFYSNNRQITLEKDLITIAQKIVAKLFIIKNQGIQNNSDEAKENFKAFEQINRLESESIKYQQTWLFVKLYELFNEFLKNKKVRIDELIMDEIQTIVNDFNKLVLQTDKSTIC